MFRTLYTVIYIRDMHRSNEYQYRHKNTSAWVTASLSSPHRVISKYQHRPPMQLSSFSLSIHPPVSPSSSTTYPRCTMCRSTSLFVVKIQRCAHHPSNTIFLPHMRSLACWKNNVQLRATWYSTTSCSSRSDGAAEFLERASKEDLKARMQISRVLMYLRHPCSENEHAGVYMYIYTSIYVWLLSRYPLHIYTYTRARIIRALGLR